MSKSSIGIGILSWNAHETLVRSLESYQENGFLDLFDERVIYFSDISEDDKKIADKYGWRYAGGPNGGIAAGMKNLGQAMTSDYITLLQNDNPICEDKSFAQNHIREAQALLENGKADIVRLRHRWNVGEGFADVTKYLKHFPVCNVSENFLPHEHGVKGKNYADNFKKKLKRFFRPFKTNRLRGRSVFVEKNPHEIYPDVMSKEGDFFIIDSSVLNFTDQCLMVSRDLWLNTFCDYVDKHPDSGRSSGGFPSPETSINGSWWRNKHFKIVQGQGIFTHDRYDGSFRADHHTRTRHSD